MSVVVRKVDDQASLKTFFEFPWRHYAKYPHWVPELPSLRRDTLDKNKHAAWEYLEGDYFVAWRDDTPIGTIAAFINHRHNQIHDENIGFFGFFECENNQDTANALFDTAISYLREKGVDAVRGPANFSSNEQWGLLMNNFEQSPMVLMPYNPEYYISLIEGYGFEKAMDLYTWRAQFTQADENYYEADGKTERRIVRAVRRGMERHEITVRPIDMKNKYDEFRSFRDLYHAAWEKNWGFVPMTERELDGLVEDLGFLIMPEYALFGFVKGEPAGFLMAVPNFNDVMKAVNPHPGLPEWWWLLKAGWHWKVRPKIRSIRVILMGVKEEYRGMGVEAGMFLHLAHQMMGDNRFDWAEAGWTLETNNAVNDLLEHFNCEMHRYYRIYERGL